MIIFILLILIEYTLSSKGIVMIFIDFQEGSIPLIYFKIFDYCLAQRLQICFEERYCAIDV